MSNVQLINAAISNQQLASQARETAAVEWNAIPADQVRQVNLDPATAVTIVMGAAPKIGALVAEMQLRIPGVDVERLKKLGTYALGFHAAHAVYLSVTESPSALQALGEEANAMRDRLAADAAPLMNRGLIDPKSLDDCRRRPGYRAAATELGVYVTVLRPIHEQIKDKCAVTTDDLDRAERISGALLRLVGVRDHAPPSNEEATDQRNRAFTLLTDVYDQACRAVSFLRWEEGDADTIAPSLYSRRKRASDVAREATRPAVPATPDVPAAPTPGVSPMTGQPVYGPPGSPTSNPFMP